MNRIINRWFLGLCFCLALIFVISPAKGPHAAEKKSEQELWRLLQSGDHFVMLRHAIAPGTGDPPGFSLGDCQTQRNLSDEGRRQARAIGERLRNNGVVNAPVFSSQWCRCLETAELLGVGEVEELPALNSFFGRYEEKQERMKTLRKWLDDQKLDRPVILVTHQVNITALTGFFPSSGEMVVVAKGSEGRFITVGTLRTE